MTLHMGVLPVNPSSSVCVCVCTCVCACVCAHVYVCVCACVHVRLCVVQAGIRLSDFPRRRTIYYSDCFGCHLRV